MAPGTTTNAGNAQLRYIGLLLGVIISSLVVAGYAGDAFNWKFVQDLDVKSGPLVDEEQNAAITAVARQVSELRDVQVKTQLSFPEAYAEKAIEDAEIKRLAEIGRSVERNMLPASGTP